MTQQIAMVSSWQNMGSFYKKLAQASLFHLVILHEIFFYL